MRRKLTKAQQSARKEYITLCAQRIRKEIERAERSIKQARAKVESLQNQLVKAIRKAQAAERQYEILSDASISAEEQLGKEFDSILALPQVRDVEINDDTLTIVTDTLYCLNPETNKYHEIGAFHIVIGAEEDNHYIRWHNQTRSVDAMRDDMQAPHVFADGHACLGNLDEILPDLIARWELAIATQLAIQFIETVNVDDSAGRYIHRWPEARNYRRRKS